MEKMHEGYFVRFRLYGVNNTMTFHAIGAYTNWTAVMIENFGDQFEFVGIYEFNY